MKTPHIVDLFVIFIMVWLANYYVEISNKACDSRDLIYNINERLVIRIGDRVVLDQGVYISLE